MSNIKTYEDLEAEQKRLEGLVYSHKASISDNLAGIRHGLKPVNLVLNTVGKAFTRDRTGPLLNFGLDFGIDLIFRKFLLAKAGWFTKIAVPFLVKNLSSHIILDRKRYLLMWKIKKVFSKAKTGDIAGPVSTVSPDPGVLS